MNEKKNGLLQWMKSRKGQKILVITTFMIVPLVLLLVFTYIPFGKMVQFSFYKMKYIGDRTFVGWDNYIELFKRKEIFGSLLVSVYYMGGAVVQLALALFFATLMVFKVKGGTIFKGAMFFPILDLWNCSWIHFQIFLCKRICAGLYFTDVWHGSGKYSVLAAGSEHQ